MGTFYHFGKRTKKTEPSFSPWSYSNMGMPQNEGILSKIPCSFYSSCSAKQETLLSLWTIYPNFSSSMSRSRIFWIKLSIFSSNLKYALVHYLSDFESSTSGSIEKTQRCRLCECRGSLSLANMVECPFCVTIGQFVSWTTFLLYCRTLKIYGTLLWISNLKTRLEILWFLG